MKKRDALRDVSKRMQLCKTPILALQGVQFFNAAARRSSTPSSAPHRRRSSSPDESDASSVGAAAATPATPPPTPATPPPRTRASSASTRRAHHRRQEMLDYENKYAHTHTRSSQAALFLPPLPSVRALLRDSGAFGTWTLLVRARARPRCAREHRAEHVGGAGSLTIKTDEQRHKHLGACVPRRRAEEAAARTTSARSAAPSRLSPSGLARAASARSMTAALSAAARPSAAFATGDVRAWPRAIWARSPSAPLFARQTLISGFSCAEFRT